MPAAAHDYMWWNEKNHASVHIQAELPQRGLPRDSFLALLLAQTLSKPLQNISRGKQMATMILVSETNLIAVSETTKSRLSQ